MTAMNTVDPMLYRSDPPGAQTDDSSTLLADALKGLWLPEGVNGELLVGYLDNSADWQRLEPCWDTLLKSTPGGTVFSSFSFLRVWWRQMSTGANLFLVVVVMAAGTVRAIAPMQITPGRWLGRSYDCLRLLGLPPEVDRPVALIPEGDIRLAHVIADYLLAHGHRWDCLTLEEQRSDCSMLFILQQKLRDSGFLMTLVEQPDCWCVEVNKKWQAYLADRSRAQRKSVKRHDNRIRKIGTTRMDTVYTGGEAARALSRYLRVEKRSWKWSARQGVAASAKRLAFYRSLAHACARSGAMHFRFLNLDGQDIAATFGLLWRGCFYSLQIAHDQAQDAVSPGFVLTARELEEACGRDDYHWVNYLGGSAINNKRGWATTQISTVTLHAHPPTLRGRILFGCRYRLRPWFKARMKRLRQLATATRPKSRAPAVCSSER